MSLDEVLIAEALGGDEKHRLRIVEKEVELGRLRPCAERHDHSAESARAKACFQPFDAVVDEDGDALTAPYAARLQRRRHLPAASGQLRIADHSAFVHRCRAIGIARSLLV